MVLFCVVEKKLRKKNSNKYLEKQSKKLKNVRKTISSIVRSIQVWLYFHMHELVDSSLFQDWQ